ncbi:hypothetical protein Tco_0565918 [Tanacetum coccineum]
MVTLADKAILSGADNRPPMLEKEMYDSWKSRIELYMLNKQHGRMILESVENGPLIWPSIEENRVTRPKKYSELSPTEAIQADCDIKATNIILQGLPPEVYALVSNHKVAKELWERIRIFGIIFIYLMQGTSLTLTRNRMSSDFVEVLHEVHKVVRDNLTVITKDHFPIGEYNNLSAKKIGPLEIIKKINSNAYRLKLPSHIRCFNVFNVKHLLPYHDDSLDDDLVGDSRMNFVYPEGTMHA